jgi:hypothetical protein
MCVQVQKSKESTARVMYWKEFGILNRYHYLFCHYFYLYYYYLYYQLPANNTHHFTTRVCAWRCVVILLVVCCF